MITLKEAMKLDKSEIVELKKDINTKARELSKLGGYIEQFSDDDLMDVGDGVPIAIKDNIAIKDAPLTCSSAILQGYKSSFSASVIDNLRLSGMNGYGRCNMDEFAMGSSTASSFYGNSLNPFDYDRTPGGSSGGSAVVVGAGIALASLGSDTGGSIRQPASFCGCVGMKPTYGRVSRYGLVAFSSSLDQIGPITQNVEDSSILYDAIAGYDKKDSTSSNVEHLKTSDKLNSNKKLKIVVIDNYLESASSEISSSILDLVKELKNSGHQVSHQNMIDTKHHLSTYYTISSAEASSNLSKFDGIKFGVREEGKSLQEVYINTRSKGFGSEVKRRILTGTFVLSSGYYDAYYIKAQKIRHLIKAEYDNVFKEADIIITPTTKDVAFKFGSKKQGLDMYLEDIYTISANLVGLPAMSIPIGKKDNLPYSVQITANLFKEQDLFDMGLAIEDIVQFSR